MNIFILHREPEIAASMLCDQHIGNQQKESIQMLSTTAHLLSLPAPYKKTHANHPATRWVRSSLQAYDWLYRHVLGMRREYERRYGKRHRSGELLEECPSPSSLSSYLCYSADELEFVQCMPNEYKHSDAIIAYRTFYILDKSQFATWRHSPPPSWWPY